MENKHIAFLREYAKCGIYHNYTEPDAKLKVMNEAIDYLSDMLEENERLKEEVAFIYKVEEDMPVRMEKDKLTKRLIRIAETNRDDEISNSAMCQLKSTVNKTYHWCPDWDFGVICDTDPEFDACTCKIK